MTVKKFPGTQNHISHNSLSESRSLRTCERVHIEYESQKIFRLKIPVLKILLLPHRYAHVSASLLED